MSCCDLPHVHEERQPNQVLTVLRLCQKTPACMCRCSSHQHAASMHKQQAISLTNALTFRQAPRRDAEVIKCVGNMWWNPKLPLDIRSAASRPSGGESALASLARDMAASQAGSRCASPLSSQLAAETFSMHFCWLAGSSRVNGMQLANAACQCSLLAEHMHLPILEKPCCNTLRECTYNRL